MCRFTAYKGRPILLGDIVIKPDNSLLRQARDAAYHPGVEDLYHHRNIVVNGDGFGLGWYMDNSSRGACCVKFTTPAWANANLRNLGDYISSPLIFAHVRAASSGHDHLEEVAVNMENCHPFKYGRWSFMHNGSIPHFKRIKRALVMLLKDECFHDITGSTDSEYIFALFLSLLSSRDEVTPLDEFIETVNRLISTILELCAAHELNEANSLNFCITDGTNMIATRFRNGDEVPPSLYYKYGSNFVCENGRLYSVDDAENPCEVVISSAPLSKNPCSSCATGECEWQLIAKDNMLICEGDPNDISRVTSVRCKHIEAGIGKGELFARRKDRRRAVSADSTSRSPFAATSTRTKKIPLPAAASQPKVSVIPYF